MDYETAEAERPNKRRKEDPDTRYHGNGESYRPRAREESVGGSRGRSDYGRGDSYRPGPSRQTAPGRQRKFTPQQADSHTRKMTQKYLKDTETEGDMSSSKSFSKAKKDHSSPSDRIHSLRKLLQHGNVQLPANVRQEKERELAALLFDRQKEKVAQKGKKNLKKYHKVRFFERQKSARALKQLKKEKDAHVERKLSMPQDLGQKLHEAEVDLNYTIYAPLGQKYISLFVTEKAKSNPTAMKKTDLKLLSADQKKALQEVSDDSLDVLRSATGTKPPMWYEVEKCMAEGEAKLEALRDGKLTQLNVGAVTLVGDREAAKERKEAGQSMKRKASWLDDDGIIDPEDLDSEQDEDMSDGEFFER